MEDNVFVNNVNKGYHDWNRGIRSFINGDWSAFNQLTFLPSGNAGFANVVFRGNTISNSIPQPATMLSVLSSPDQFDLYNNVFSGSNSQFSVSGAVGANNLSFDARSGIPWKVYYQKPVGTILSPIQGPAGYTFFLDGGGNLGLNWTPKDSDGGTTNEIVFQQVQFGASVTNRIHISIPVTPRNTPPSIASIRETDAQAGYQSMVQVNAVDAESKTNGLTYALINSPTNMVIDSGTGLVTWSPAPADFDLSYSPVIKVTDSSSPPLSSFMPIQVASVLPAALVCGLSSNGVVWLGGDTNSPHLVLAQSSSSVTQISPVGVNGSGFVIDPTTNRAVILNPGPTFYSGVYLRRNP